MAKMNKAVNIQAMTKKVCEFEKENMKNEMMQFREDLKPEAWLSRQIKFFNEKIKFKSFSEIEGKTKLNPVFLIFSDETRLPFNNMTASSPNIILRKNEGTLGSHNGFCNFLAINFVNSLFVICSGATAL